MVDQLSFAAKAPTRANVVEPDPLKGGDVYKWAMEQSAYIRAGQCDKVDLVNVADEIESVGKSEFGSLASHIEIILAHILEWDIQPQRRSRSWVNSIGEHRERVGFDLQDNPSLKPRLEEAVGLAYRLARYADASKETKLALKSFPDICPYSWDDIANRAFVLNQTDEVS